LTIARGPSSSGSKTNKRPQHPNLGRGEADALGVVHQHDHAVDKTAQVVVELGHLVRDEAQRAVRVLPDLREREAPAGIRLGLGTGLLGAVLVVGVVVVGVVVLVIVLVFVIVRHRRCSVEAASEALGIHVDDGSQLRAPHRRGGRGEQPRRL